MNNIPGSNLLKKAFKIISKDTFIFRQFDSRTTNNIGIDVPTYKPDVEIKGSVQAVSRQLYQENGLDWKKNYIMIYSSEAITGVDRDSSGDRIIFNGKNFQVLDENDWLSVDGWNGVMCVEVGQ